MSAKNDRLYQDDDDERMARDMQLALDMQMAEDFAAHEQQDATTIQAPLSSEESFQVEHGFYNIQQQNDHMLFVACTLDSHRRKVNLLVDSGASVSAMSLAMVHKLGLQDKLNVAVSGACGGVGSANIVGVVENLAACLAGQVVEFRLYFLVIDSELPSVVLGLDQMRRFQCVIDMERDCLCFGGRDGVQVPFLSVPEARKARKDYDRMIRGTTVAGGATRQPTTTRSNTGRAATGASTWIPSLFGRNRPGPSG